jgi:hypothetical protein
LLGLALALAWLQIVGLIDPDSLIVKKMVHGPDSAVIR